MEKLKLISKINLVKNIHKENKKIWNKYEDDGERVYYISEYLQSRLIRHMQIRQMGDKLSNKIKRKENELFDVSKIFVNEKTYNEMKEHDFEIGKVLWGEIYKDEKIRKDISMGYFMSGPCISKDSSLKDGYFYFDPETIIKR